MQLEKFFGLNMGNALMSCTPLTKKITNAVRASQLTQLLAKLVKRIVLVTRIGELFTSTIFNDIYPDGSEKILAECFGENVQLYI